MGLLLDTASRPDQRCRSCIGLASQRTRAMRQTTLLDRRRCDSSRESFAQARAKMFRACAEAGWVSRPETASTIAPTEKKLSFDQGTDLELEHPGLAMFKIGLVAVLPARAL